MVFEETFTVELKTSDTELKKYPNETLANPLKEFVYVNSIQLILDAYFISNGSIRVMIGTQQVFNSEDKGLLGSKNIVLPFQNLKLDKGKKINFFFYNKSNEETEITGISYIKLSDNPILQTSAIQTANPLDLLTEKSESINLIPFKIYYNEVVTSILDMKGYKKLIVIMASSLIPDLIKLSNTVKISNIPTHSIGNFFNVSHPYSYFIASDQFAFSEFDDWFLGTIIQLLNFGNRSSYLRLVESNVTKIVYDNMGIGNDFGITFDYVIPIFVSNPIEEVMRVDSTNQVHKHLVSLQSKNFIRIEESDSEFGNYTLVKDYEEISDILGESVILSKKYVKILHKTNIYMQWEISFINGLSALNSINTPSLQRTEDPILLITNTFNQFHKNGSGSLSFEIRDPETNIWSEFINEDEFDTVTEGQEVIRQIGDVNQSLLDKTYALPSTQTDFRAKFTIVFGLQSGISIQKIL